MLVKYYDIGVNLFCRQFPNPEIVIQKALDSGVHCILTGTDSKENRKIDDFVPFGRDTHAALEGVVTKVTRVSAGV